MIEGLSMKETYMINDRRGRQCVLERTNGQRQLIVKNYDLMAVRLHIDILRAYSAAVSRRTMTWTPKNLRDHS